MNPRYSCPQCSAILNPKSYIILLGRHEGQEGLFVFNPEPGNYEVYIPFNVAVNRGEAWDFHCPVCQENLILSGEVNLAALDMMDGAGNWHKVVFSRIAGEQATFVVSQNPDVEVKEYGVNFSKYEHCLWEKYI